MENEQNKAALEKEITELKSQLDSINKKKEEAFSKKEELKSQLSELIKKAKGVTSHKKTEGVNVSELKKQRDHHNSNVKNLIIEIKALGGGQHQGVDMQDFSRLKKELEALEFKVEHEALSPSEEKKTMKKIKDIRKHYDSQNEIVSNSGKIHELSRKIEEEKKLADQFHAQLVAAKGDTVNYNELKTVSKEILEMRSKEEAEFANFIKLKQEFKEVSDRLKQKLIQAGHKPEDFRNKESHKGSKQGGFKDKPHQERARHSDNQHHDRHNKKKFQKTNTQPPVDEKKKQEQMRIIKEKIKVVEEKMKSGQKLTTEDLLIMQQNTD